MAKPRNAAPRRGAPLWPAHKIHLLPRHRALLEDIFQRLLPWTEVLAYGSRVTGQSHGGSDLDLALRLKGGGRIGPLKLAALREELSESSIPFFVEVRDFSVLPPSFQDEIERSSVLLFKGLKKPGS